MSEKVITLTASERVALIDSLKPEAIYINEGNMVIIDAKGKIAIRIKVENVEQPPNSFEQEGQLDE